MFYDLQIRWGGKWRTIEGWFPTREDAEEAARDWMIAVGCQNNPFRSIQSREPRVAGQPGVDNNELPF